MNARRLSRLGSALLLVGFAACAAQQKQAEPSAAPGAKKSEPPPAAPAIETSGGATPGTGGPTGTSPVPDAPSKNTGSDPTAAPPPPPPPTTNVPTTPPPVAEPPKGAPSKAPVPSPPPTAGVKPDPMPTKIGMAQQKFDDAHAAFVGASGCPAMCKALDSMKNATEHLCALASGSEQKRCGDAQAKLQKATAKVKSVCGGCGA